MKRALKIAIWLLLWAGTGAWIWWSTREADYQFQKYMEAGSPTMETACELIPGNVDAFACHMRFRGEWKEFRRTGLCSTLKGLSVFREAAEALKITGSDLSPIEKWTAEFWGPGLVAAYSRKSETLYLLSPVGRREECIDWFRRMAVSDFGGHITWKPHELDVGVGKGAATAQKGLSCFDADSTYFSSPGWNVQFHAVRGVAVLAISRKRDPLLEMLQVDREPGRSLAKSPGFMEFFRRGLDHPEQPFGFVRLAGGAAPSPGLGLEWKVSRGAEDRVILEASLPVPGITGTAVNDPQLDPLDRVRQPEDLVGILCTWEDVKALWNGISPRLSAGWKDPVEQVRVEEMLGSYKDIWKPVLDGLGHEVFIGFGDANPLSERFTLPIPRTILACPFTDSAGFMKALEATVLKCNREEQADLLIRKVVRPFGEYHVVRMGNASWKSRHGLKELPVFAFSNGILLLAPGEDTMEKALRHLVENAGRPVDKITGVDIRLDMRKSPNTVRILLGALGTLNPRGDNVFLTPAMMRSMSEISSLMEQFGESRLVLSYRPGFIELRATLKP